MFEAEDKTGYKRCLPGDLAINTLWAWMGAMGISSLEGIVSPDYHVYTSKGQLLPEYVEHRRLFAQQEGELGKRHGLAGVGRPRAANRAAPRPWRSPMRH